MSCPGAWVMLVSSNRTDLCQKGKGAPPSGLAGLRKRSVDGKAAEEPWEKHPHRGGKAVGKAPPSWLAGPRKKSSGKADKAFLLAHWGV